MADVDRIFEIEMVGKLREIGDISVHVVAEIGLSRAAVSATIMRDDP